MIRRFLERLGAFERYAVDIGASDGWTSSNTYFLLRRGWKGLALECDDARFEKLVSLHADPDGDDGLPQRDQHDEPVALDEMLGADAKPSDRGHDRRRPMQDERGRPERPLRATAREAGDQDERGYTGGDPSFTTLNAAG